MPRLKTGIAALWGFAGLESQLGIARHWGEVELISRVLPVCVENIIVRYILGSSPSNRKAHDNGYLRGSRGYEGEECYPPEGE